MTSRHGRPPASGPGRPVSDLNGLSTPADGARDRDDAAAARVAGSAWRALSVPRW
ncbi:hypothetical protein [Streptomyces sp. NPDC004135]